MRIYQVIGKCVTGSLLAVMATIAILATTAGAQEPAQTCSVFLPAADGDGVIEISANTDGTVANPGTVETIVIDGQVYQLVPISPDVKTGSVSTDAPISMETADCVDLTSVSVSTCTVKGTADVTGSDDEIVVILPTELPGDQGSQEAKPGSESTVEVISAVDGCSSDPMIDVVPATIEIPAGSFTCTVEFDSAAVLDSGSLEGKIVACTF